jgi:hypothetical protein
LKTHPAAAILDDVGIHPNGYFEASIAFYSKDTNGNYSGKKFINGNMNNSTNKKPTPNSRVLDSQNVPTSATKN